MIRADREILSHLSAVNQAMGQIVLRLLGNLGDEAELPPQDLLSVGTGLVSLAAQLQSVGDEMIQRAQEHGTPALPECSDG